jgi:rubrerythrin
MKHFLLKFNHGVEIGARLAYLGHYDRVGHEKIKSIAYDELRHKLQLEDVLKHFGEEANPIIDAIFWTIGHTIKWLCRYCPRWSLDLVARSMEMFAIFNYTKLADLYPEWKVTFLHMANAEKDHEEYFRLGPIRYKQLNDLRASLVGGTYGSRPARP